MATSILTLDPVTLKNHFKDRCRATNNVYQNWQIRVHRSLSWLKRSVEFSEEELEARFLFLWIALNSLYSRWDAERNAPGQDSQSRREFFHRICLWDPASIAAA